MSFNTFRLRRFKTAFPVLGFGLLLFLVACDQAPEATFAESDSAPVATAAATEEPLQATPVESIGIEEAPTATTEALPATNTPAATAEPESGGLIQMSFASQVGVLIDGVPDALRDDVIERSLGQTDAEWLALAKQQIRLTRLRLNFRGFGVEGLGQLPLTPQEIWTVELDPGGPSLIELNGHDIISIGYTFETTILTDLVSPGQVEPALAETGGIWLEPFVFPADPTLLTQRTGNACINEAGFPPNSYDSQNFWYLYDYECTAESAGALGCHRTAIPNFSCQEALDSFIGSVPVDIQFERLQWDDDIADSVRLGPNNPETEPDIEVVDYELGINRIIYRWFPPEDCALAEDAVSGAGWRRILQFNATVHNIGSTPLEIGRVSEFDVSHNVFEYSPCHDHFHYSNYGSFDLVDVALPFSSKKAFCVQSTSRFSNNESSPLDHEYSCTDQGIQAGWVDEYIAGLDVQWVDITDLQLPEEGMVVTLGFSSNADGFICEGDPIVDENGELMWEPSGFFTTEGAEIDRPLCEFVEDWDRNNYAEIELTVPQVGSFVTEPCTNNAFGPLRNCGFTPLQLDGNDNSCQPGETVELSLPGDMLAETMILRVCERSALLGGLACDFKDSVRSTPVTLANNNVSFVCPDVRDGAAGSGSYSLYVAPYLLPSGE